MLHKFLIRKVSRQHTIVKNLVWERWDWNHPKAYDKNQPLKKSFAPSKVSNLKILLTVTLSHGAHTHPPAPLKTRRTPGQDAPGTDANTVVHSRRDQAFALPAYFSGAASNAFLHPPEQK